MLGADDACGVGGMPAKLRASVRTRSMGTVVRTMVACMGIPFLWSGQWSSRAPARVWTRVVRESTSDEPAELPTGVKEVVAMFA